MSNEHVPEESLIPNISISHQVVTQDRLTPEIPDKVLHSDDYLQSTQELPKPQLPPSQPQWVNMSQSSLIHQREYDYSHQGIPVQPPQLHLPPLPSFSPEKMIDKGLSNDIITLGYMNQPPPPPHMIENLFNQEGKSTEDISSLLKYGVDLNVIAEVKNTTIQALLNFCAVKAIPIPTQALTKELLNVSGLEHQTHQPIKHRTSHMLDDEGKKKRREPWKKQDFPGRIEGVDYYCADCKKGNKTYHCDCKRKCWRWCEECKGFRSNHHDHFRGSNPKKRRKPWNEKDFPAQKEGTYYCADCKKNNSKRLCECGRDSWKWCQQCGEYRSKHHFSLHQASKEEEPLKKKRKLI